MKKTIFSTLLLIFLLIPLTTAYDNLFFTDPFEGLIYRINMDNGYTRLIYTSETYMPYGIEVDQLNKKLYFTSLNNYLNATIHRMNFNGTDHDILVTGLHVPRSLALDVENNLMYWTEVGGGTNRISRANLDGTNIEILLRRLGGGDIELDKLNNYLYWNSGQSRRSILRLNLDNYEYKGIYNGPKISGIEIDPINNELYWADGLNFNIVKASTLMDNSTVSVLLDQGLSQTGDIDIDFAAKKMYWSEWGDGFIKRANLDGTNVEILYENPGHRYHQIAIYKENPISLIYN